MSLFTATLIMAVILILKGVTWIVYPGWVMRMKDHFLRSQAWAYVMFGTAGVWFLYKILHLSAADFGEYKHILFLLFSAVIIGSFIFVRDFLAVRGWAIVVLLLADFFLDATYMAEPWQKIFLTILLYIMILEALYFGTVPYKMRDFMNWLFDGTKRMRILAYCMLAYGALLAVVAFTY